MMSTPGITILVQGEEEEDWDHWLEKWEGNVDAETPTSRTKVWLKMKKTKMKVEVDWQCRGREM